MIECDVVFVSSDALKGIAAAGLGVIQHSVSLDICEDWDSLFYRLSFLSGS